MDANAFGERAKNIKVQSVAIHINWKIVELYHDRQHLKLQYDKCLYAIYVLELEGKIRRVSTHFPRNASKAKDGELSRLGLAILYLVQGHIISKPAKESVNRMWITYISDKIRRQIEKKIKTAARRKAITSRIDKFANKKHRSDSLMELKKGLFNAFNDGIRKQDIISVWDDIVRESIVKKVMDD